MECRYRIFTEFLAESANEASKQKRISPSETLFPHRDFTSLILMTLILKWFIAKTSKKLRYFLRRQPNRSLNHDSISVYVQELEEEEGKPYLAVFMMATYGEGDPTDNAMEFNEKLQENIIYSLYPMNTFKCLNKF